MRTSKISLIGILLVAAVFVGGLGCKKPQCTYLTGCPSTTTFDAYFYFQYVNSGINTSAKVGFDGVIRYPYDPGSRGSCAIFPVRCQLVRAFFASPFSFNLTSPPATGSIYGQDISSAYGMPVIEYRDADGTYVTQTTATEVASDGTWLSGPVPWFGDGYNGTYQLWVKNRNWDGSYTEIGVATVEAYGRDWPPDDPDDSDDPECPCGWDDVVEDCVPCEY
jgi:hypothetical protein